MRIVAALRGNSSRTNERVQALGEALNAEFTLREQPDSKADLYIQAGFQISPCLQDAMQRGIPFVICENPVWHYGDKADVMSVGFNGLNGLAYRPEAGTLPRPRPQLRPMKWRNEKAATVFGQMVGDKSLRGLDVDAWVNDKLNQFPNALFRPHPKMLDSWSREFKELQSLEACFAETGLAVTYSSTIGAEALIAGIPTIAEHPGSFAYSYAGDREEWLHNLSYAQWGVAEAQACGEWLMKGYDKAKHYAEMGIYDNCSNGRAQ